MGDLGALAGLGVCISSAPGFYGGTVLRHQPGHAVTLLQVSAAMCGHSISELDRLVLRLSQEGVRGRHKSMAAGEEVTSQDTVGTPRRSGVLERRWSLAQCTFLPCHLSQASVFALCTSNTHFSFVS